MIDQNIKDILLEITRLGLLNIRYYGYEGNHHQVVNEADHIHNLPRLVCDGNMSHLHYYMTAEVPCYLQNADGLAPLKFDELWKKLSALQNAQSSP